MNSADTQPTHAMPPTVAEQFAAVEVNLSQAKGLLHDAVASLLANMLAIHRALAQQQAALSDRGAARQKGRAAGATGWMVKPFDPERLLCMVRKVLG